MLYEAEKNNLGQYPFDIAFKKNKSKQEHNNGCLSSARVEKQTGPDIQDLWAIPLISFLNDSRERNAIFKMTANAHIVK